MAMFRGIFRDLRRLSLMDLIKHNMQSVALIHKLPAVQKVEYFPLHEIKDLNRDHLNCDGEKWNKIIHEILQGKADGKMVPECLSMRNIEDLVECPTKGQRTRYLEFLFKKERKRAGDKEKKHRKTEGNSVNSTNKSVSDHIEYGLGKNTLLLAARKASLRAFSIQKLANAVLFGQKMVIDLSYDEFMCKKERRDCVAQLRLVYSTNRQQCDPLDLYYCNAKKESRCVQYLCEEMPAINEPLECMTEQSYLDLFPKESLVYLSPHASETLTTYDHNAVYIIGAFVDTVKRDHISLHKSEKEGIKSYSLPLDKYVLWGYGSKSLSINQVFSIMLTMRDTGDWKEAFKHIPTRKLRRIGANESLNEHIADKMFIIRN